MQMKGTVDRCIKNLKSHPVVVCKISPLKAAVIVEIVIMRQLKCLMSNWN